MKRRRKKCVKEIWLIQDTISRETCIDLDEQIDRKNINIDFYQLNANGYEIKTKETGSWD